MSIEKDDFVPDEMKKLIDEKLAGMNREEASERAKRNKAKQDELKRQEEGLKNGLEHAKRIFEWVDGFRKTETGKKLIQLGNRGYLGGVYFFNGHVFGKPFRGLGFDNKSVWWISTGCGAHPRPLETPKELAEAIAPETLKLACEWIDTGKIWECIKAWHLERH